MLSFLAVSFPYPTRPKSCQLMKEQLFLQTALCQRAHKVFVNIKIMLFNHIYSSVKLLNMCASVTVTISL